MRHISPRATTLSEFLTRVKDVQQRWMSQALWFRGHAHIDWKLRAGIYREPFSGMGVDAETSMMIDFGRRSYPFTGRTLNNGWEMLTLAQHHGLPTRLLDWSESALVGLFFAIEAANSMADGCVWLLDPCRLNEHAGVGRAVIVLSAAQGAMEPYLSPFTSSSRVGRDNVLAVRPAHIATRVTAQRGVFTLFGDQPSYLDEIFDDESQTLLERVVIPSESFASIMDELRTAGVTPSTLYPDIDGLAREIRRDLVRGISGESGLSAPNMPASKVFFSEILRTNIQIAARLTRAAETSPDHLRAEIVEVQSEVVTVDVSSCNSDYPAPIAIECGQEDVSSFLAGVWDLIRNRVGAFSYGTHWYLKKKGGEALSLELGSAYSKSIKGDNWRYYDDNRTLAEVGIVPGLELEVVLVG